MGKDIMMYPYAPKTRELGKPEKPQLDAKGNVILISGQATPDIPGPDKEGYSQVYKKYGATDFPYDENKLILASRGEYGEWWYIEDHRQKMNERGQPIEGTGTPYWPKDATYRTPCSYTKDLGPLPDGALLEQPRQTVEEAREIMISRLKSAFSIAETSGHVMSSLGFEINATERSRHDVEGLILSMEAGYSDLIENDTPKIMFCAYDNSFHAVTISDLKILRMEIVKYSQALYVRKWKLREQIMEDVKTAEQIMDIDISFDDVSGTTA